MFKYEIVIYWSNPDQVFVAEVPELPGCMAHGPSSEEALKNVQDAMGLWLSVAEEKGRAIPEPKGRRLMYA
jgi:predicted RNase H-like HicB family nuclease